MAKAPISLTEDFKERLQELRDIQIPYIKKYEYNISLNHYQELISSDPDNARAYIFCRNQLFKHIDEQIKCQFIQQIAVMSLSDVVNLILYWLKHCPDDASTKKKELFEYSIEPVIQLLEQQQTQDRQNNTKTVDQVLYSLYRFMQTKVSAIKLKGKNIDSDTKKDLLKITLQQLQSLYKQRPQLSQSQFDLQVSKLIPEQKGFFHYQYAVICYLCDYTNDDQEFQMPPQLLGITSEHRFQILNWATAAISSHRMHYKEVINELTDVLLKHLYLQYDKIAKSEILKNPDFPKTVSVLRDHEKYITLITKGIVLDKSTLGLCVCAELINSLNGSPFKGIQGFVSEKKLQADQFIHQAPNSYWQMLKGNVKITEQSKRQLDRRIEKFQQVINICQIAEHQARFLYIIRAFIALGLYPNALTLRVSAFAYEVQELCKLLDHVPDESLRTSVDAFDSFSKYLMDGDGPVTFSLIFKWMGSFIKSWMLHRDILKRNPDFDVETKLYKKILIFSDSVSRGQYLENVPQSMNQSLTYFSNSSKETAIYHRRLRFQVATENIPFDQLESECQVIYKNQPIRLNHIEMPYIIDGYSKQTQFIQNLYAFLDRIAMSRVTDIFAILSRTDAVHIKALELNQQPRVLIMADHQIYEVILDNDMQLDPAVEFNMLRNHIVFHNKDYNFVKTKPSVTINLPPAIYSGEQAPQYVFCEFYTNQTNTITIRPMPIPMLHRTAADLSLMGQQEGINPIKLRILPDVMSQIKVPITDHQDLKQICKNMNTVSSTHIYKQFTYTAAAAGENKSSYIIKYTPLYQSFPVQTNFKLYHSGYKNYQGILQRRHIQVSAGYTRDPQVTFPNIVRVPYKVVKHVFTPAVFEQIFSDILITNSQDLVVQVDSYFGMLVVLRMLQGIIRCHSSQEVYKFLSRGVSLPSALTRQIDSKYNGNSRVDSLLSLQTLYESQHMFSCNIHFVCNGIVQKYSHIVSLFTQSLFDKDTDQIQIQDKPKDALERPIPLKRKGSFSDIKRNKDQLLDPSLPPIKMMGKDDSAKSVKDIDQSIFDAYYQYFITNRYDQTHKFPTHLDDKLKTSSGDKNVPTTEDNVSYKFNVSDQSIIDVNIAIDLINKCTQVITAKLYQDLITQLQNLRIQLHQIRDIPIHLQLAVIIELIRQPDIDTIQLRDVTYEVLSHIDKVGSIFGRIVFDAISIKDATMGFDIIIDRILFWMVDSYKQPDVNHVYRAFQLLDALGCSRSTLENRFLAIKDSIERSLKKDGIQISEYDRIIAAYIQLFN